MPSFSYPLTALPGEDAWHPGLEAIPPASMFRLCTLFLPENADRTYDEALALRDLCGLSVEELAVLNAQRLVLHELLIRVMADWSVQDGPRVADLGISFRTMIERLLEKYILPHVPEFNEKLDLIRTEISAALEEEWLKLYPEKAPEASRPAQGWLSRWYSRLIGEEEGVSKARAAHQAMTDEVSDRDLLVLAQLEREANHQTTPVVNAARQALRRTLFGIHHRQGRLWGDKAVVLSIAREVAVRDYAPRILGLAMNAYLEEGAQQEGYKRLPIQARPMVMNIKGASASGKSTMRPLQRALADRLGVRWDDFALISPDIWRKHLLDYPSMGKNHKYAGFCTGFEVQIIDMKLDRYMAEKAEHGKLPHLLIDRFRFDSFAPDSTEAGTNLLTRFGQDVYMFFMVTPPEAIVARAWKRGLDVGRFKAVEDVLGHNVEAYTGIPLLLFRWATRQDKVVHFEFLDNTQPLGEPPQTLAFGMNQVLVILDIMGFFNIEKYRKINVHATCPEELYPDPDRVTWGRCAGFLKQCAKEIPRIYFVDQATGITWAMREAGSFRILDRTMAKAKCLEPAYALGLKEMFGEEVIRQAEAGALEAGPAIRTLLDTSSIQSLGQWGWAEGKHAPGMS